MPTSGEPESISIWFAKARASFFCERVEVYDAILQEESAENPFGVRCNEGWTSLPR